MSRNFKIHNILHHQDISVSIPDNPVMVTGKNSSGKTSFAKTLAAVVTHNNNPWGLSAALSKAYIKNGTIEGNASINNGATWKAPNEMMVPPGVLPEASIHTTGIQNFVIGAGTQKANKSKIYEDLYLPTDPETLLRPAWKHEEVQLLSVINIIKERGWQSAANNYGDLKKSEGAKWAKISGQQYGKKKAVTWRPDDYTSDMEGISEQALLDERSLAQEAIQKITVTQAVAQERVDYGEKARDEFLPLANEAVTTAQQEYDRKMNAEQVAVNNYKTEKAKTDEITNQINKLLSEKKQIIVNPARPKGEKCPSCQILLLRPQGQPLAIMGENPPPPNNDLINEQNALIGEQIAELDASLKNYNVIPLLNEYRQMQAEVAATRDLLNQAKGHRDTVAKTALDANLVASDSNDAYLSHHENIRQAAVNKHKAFHKHVEAQRAHENYTHYESIEKLLSANGIRSEYMQVRMDNLRDWLDTISKVTGWLPITITEGYDPLSNGLPAHMTAENEQRKVQWAISAAIAMQDKTCKWLILDAADLLKDESWEGLVKLVDKLQIRAIQKDKRDEFHIVVCATSAAIPPGWSGIKLS